jgi:L-threonylcarbamoyladenylate synthase
VSGVLDVDTAVTALAAGQVVALPTDTVYGLGASIAFPDAVAALYELKGRPANLALPVAAPSLESLHDLVTEWPAGAEAATRTFWPGALTVVVGAVDWLAELVHSPSGRVGFRVPDDAVLLDLLGRTGPIALTSANAHAAKPCASPAEVLATFEGRPGFAGVLDGALRDGSPSTVVEFEGDEWRLLRAGAIGLERLTSLLGSPKGH